MKFKATAKEIKSRYTVIRVGYCDLQKLLGAFEPIAYTAGAEGWHSDIYTFGGIAIATGYRPFGDIRPSYDLVSKYEQQARAVCADYYLPSDRLPLLQDLVTEFITDATGR